MDFRQMQYFACLHEEGQSRGLRSVCVQPQ